MGDLSFPVLPAPPRFGTITPPNGQPRLIAPWTCAHCLREDCDGPTCDGCGAPKVKAP